jgi:ABC-type transport system involved in cytochrome bd biosynthesis fused ATPase/permease subunit
MPQRPRLGTGTLRDVVRAGAAADDDAVRAALAAASVSELVDRLPDGLDTVLDEQPTFSVGETRRLALARALVRPAEVVLLDEPTASLDPESAASVIEGIGRIPRDRIVVVATHDERVVARADAVVGLHDGRVVTGRETVAA